MRLTNATLVSIEPAPRPNADGGEVAQPPVAVGVAVMLNAVTGKQRYMHGATIAEATASMFGPVELHERLPPDAVVHVKPREGSETSMRVVYAVRNSKSGGLSHTEAFLRQL